MLDMGSGIPLAALSGPLPPLAAEPGLFDPTAPLDAEAAPSVWGVDCSSERVSIAVNGAPPVWATKSFTRPPRKRLPLSALRTISEETEALARSLVVRVGEPELVVVEQPTGKHPAPSLMYATGAILAGLGALDTRIELIGVSQWKSRSVGHGFAKKDQILRWAQGRGYAGRLEDEADALGIAVGGAVLFGLS